MTRVIACCWCHAGCSWWSSNRTKDVMWPFDLPENFWCSKEVAEKCLHIHVLSFYHVLSYFSLSMIDSMWLLLVSISSCHIAGLLCSHWQTYSDSDIFTPCWMKRAVNALLLFLLCIVHVMMQPLRCVSFYMLRSLQCRNGHLVSNLHRSIMATVDPLASPLIVTRLVLG